MLTIGSLFSGIGGLELGLEWAGLGPTLWQVEQNDFCRTVLKKHWPKAERFEDVREIGKSKLCTVDLVCGGFPCQDVSSAGPRTGLTGSRSGLWCEFARVVEEILPEWVVIENVKSGGGHWLDSVVRDMEQLGYGCLPVPVSARDVGAPHLRERLFIVAHADGIVLRNEQGRRESRTGEAKLRDDGEKRLAPDPDGSRQLQSQGNEPDQRSGPGEQVEGRPGPASHSWRAPEPGVVPLVHGLSGGLAGRRRRARIRALGNAVVPQCAEVVGWVIRELIDGNY